MKADLIRKKQERGINVGEKARWRYSDDACVACH